MQETIQPSVDQSAHRQHFRESDQVDANARQKILPAVLRIRQRQPICQIGKRNQHQIDLIQIACHFDEIARQIAPTKYADDHQEDQRTHGLQQRVQDGKLL